MIDLRTRKGLLIDLDMSKDFQQNTSGDIREITVSILYLAPIVIIN